jgi:hypothetical protein
VHVFPEYRIAGPYEGIYLVAGDGAIAAIASLRLWGSEQPRQFRHQTD